MASFPQPPALTEGERAWLAWQIAAGADEALADAPVDRYAAPARAEAPSEARAEGRPAIADAAPARAGTPRPAAARPAAARPPLVGTAAPSGATGSAEELARAARSLEELREALMAFEDCALKRTATNLVFGDGNPHAPLMIVGEAPGADEDRLGVPFVGVSGRLLDRMMAAIGLDRTGFYITNVLPWRPPGNRNPSAEDLALCLPFIRRHVALVRPKVLLMVGGASAKALLDRSEGIMRLRGRWLAYRAPELEAPIPALATYHPAYLLRQPGQKRDAWRDLVQLKLRLIELGLVPGS